MSASGNPIRNKEIEQAHAQLVQLLERTASLLLDPVPDHIEEVGKLIEVATTLLREHQQGATMLSTSEVIVLRARCCTVQMLLASAAKVHWHRMRKMGVSLESYTPAGGSCKWVQPISSFNLDC